MKAAAKIILCIVAVSVFLATAFVADEWVTFKFWQWMGWVR